MYDWFTGIFEEMLDFSNILNISIKASWVILAVLLARLLLKKAPKWTHVALWGIVAARLLLPFSIESTFSLIPSSETVSSQMIQYEGTQLNDSAYLDIVTNPHFSDNLSLELTQSADRVQLSMMLMNFVWLAGMAVMLLYTIVSYIRLKRKVSTAVLLRDNVYRSENVTSPFAFGVFTPKIYLPFRIDEQDLEHVVAHEQAHIRRRDYLWKPLGFLLLTIHWFNPLMWLAYILLCRDIELACDEDIELACDEKVIKDLGKKQRADYSQALLSCSVNRFMIAACPLAFGEVGVKERVKSVLSYKKPAFWLIIAAILICAVIAVCFLTEPKQDNFDIKIVVPAGSQESFVYSDEEISPTRNQIIISSGDNLGDTEVVLKPVEVRQENAYEPTYLTPGLPVKMDAEIGAWFKIGINMQNPTNEDIVVHVNVENIEVRISSNYYVDLEQYRTDYIGDASKVSAIAQHLPYPEGYSYSSIELQTRTEPYELIVYLNGEGNVQETAFRSCATTAFNLIENMGIISFRNAASESVIASFDRTDYAENMKFYLTIGEDGIASIEITAPNTSGGCRHADGSPFERGERIWLEHLDGLTDLRGLAITALNENGEIIWSASIPDGEGNSRVTHLSQDGWIITNIE